MRTMRSTTGCTWAGAIPVKSCDPVKSHAFVSLPDDVAAD